jgi:peptidoglycan/LPS O-acetylase OafA/YrhL
MDLQTSTEKLASKPHYEILDGLRGVAAIYVLCLHIMEAHSIGAPDYPYDTVFNHCYLAVDFFFVLSGFVIGYAYDDRWGKMGVWTFFKRRIIRLHPMVVIGMVLGALLFYFGASSLFPLISGTPVWKMLLYLLLGILLIPTPPSADIRGWEEMHTLDAPAWTLFFEYIGNLLYALFIRKFSTKALAVFVGLAACATVYLTLTNGSVIGGWTFNAHHLHIGFTRLFFPFFAGLLMFRLHKLGSIKNAFLRCSVILTVLFVMPRIETVYIWCKGLPLSVVRDEAWRNSHLWMNGIYEMLVILFVFPLVVYMGASGKVTGRFSSKLCKFLGDVSYPVYLVNYPLVYIYLGWISDTHYTIGEVWYVAAGVFVATIALSWLLMRYCELPIRNWLRKVWK